MRGVCLAEAFAEMKWPKFKDLKIVNLAPRQLTIDPQTPGDASSRTVISRAMKNPRQVPKSHISYVTPDSPPLPKILSLNASFLAGEMSLELEENSALESSEALGILCGSAPFPLSNSWSYCYGGHQFGSWAGQLGDGRAISIAQVQDRNGKYWELQLKGAGLTPYSRFADGYAVVRSSIREYLAAEAMVCQMIDILIVACSWGSYF